MKSTLVYCVIFVAAAMSVMLYYAATKTVRVADLAQDEVVRPAVQGESAPSVPTKENEIVINRGGQNTNYFCIPMPESVKAEEVVLENHYMDKELWVSISTEQTKDYEAFYRTGSVYGNCENVADGRIEAEKDRVCLRFSLDGVYEYRSIFENHTLYVEFVPSKEVYEKIIVIDPAYGGGEHGVAVNGAVSKKITLDIAKALKTMFDESDIKVYYTRMDDSNPAAADRVELAAATRADMLIRIEVSGDENSKLYGTSTVYNSKFFIPGFGNVELADLLEREVVTSISGKACGLIESSAEDQVVNSATVPAAAVRVGYLTNSQEAILLQREDYIRRIAEGIYNAVVKAYEQREE
ncbi:MAG: N-acetylmuramoyl-L-alanine amidase [Lachnospiraceae bacterium]|nr:N-acetylmuramoyl-L-alanine amidase [Lachnospiraceae bacterium]